MAAVPSATAGPGVPCGVASQSAACSAVGRSAGSSFEKVKNRGNALNSTAWQRLIRAAGGEGHVAAYCAQLTAPAGEATPLPTKTNKTGKTGKDNGRPSVEAKPSKRPSTRP